MEGRKQNASRAEDSTNEQVNTSTKSISRGHILAKDFLQTLYGNESNGWLTLWTSEDKKTKWYKVQELESAVNDAMNLRESKNVYFGLGLRKENLGEYKRGANKDIISLPCVWVEIDIKGGIHAADNLPTEEEVQSILNTFPLEPSIVNNSGGGLHCYWLLDQPARIYNKKNMQSAERMLIRFQSVFIRLARAKGLKIDNTADLARVLRVAGTFNRKGEPKPVGTQLFKPDNRYSIMDLSESIEEMESKLPSAPIERRERREYEGEIPDAKYVDKITNGCHFIHDYLDHKETAPYDEWIAALSIASYCEDGENLVHEWSTGHPNYDEQEVDRKYQHIREEMKPRTCQSIHQDFGKCGSCPHFNKINSPIALGMEKKEFSKKEPPKKEKPKIFRRTDLGNAERLIHRHGANLKYNSVFGKWYIWDGKVWNEDKVNEMQQRAKDTVRSIYKEAYMAEDDDSRKAISTHAAKSENIARVRAMVSLAESEVPILPDDMDSDVWLLNCKNGVVNLKTGELKPHNRDYMMTKLSPVAYDSQAKCPTWEKFLEDVMRDEEGNVKHELIDFLQKSVGYSLTGDTSEQVLFFFYGTGRNGKSTFMNVVNDVLGDYGKQTNAETFTVKKSDRVNNDIAALKGARLVAATESEEGARLAESLVKQLTGGEPILARFLHQEFFEFVPQFKIFFTTNHKPVIRNNDEGIWRRIRLVPFTVRIPDEKLDKDLPKKLNEEMSGILRWAVEGCLKWQKEGLGNPKEVEEATASYRDEMDTMGNFLQEHCTVHDNAKCVVSDLYKKYTEWCEENGEYELSKQRFNRKIEERGFKKKRSTGGHYYFFGIGLQELSLVNAFSSKSEEVKFREEKNSNFPREKEKKKYGENTSPEFTSSLDNEKVVPELL
jgi:P4 family phage/plasmid primase-like protien